GTRAAADGVVAVYAEQSALVGHRISSWSKRGYRCGYRSRGLLPGGEVFRVENRGVLRQIEPATGEIGGDDTSRQLRIEDGERDQIFLALDERFGDAIHGMAARNAARNLRDDERRDVHLGMLAVILHQRASYLLWRGEADVGDEVAVDHVGEVNADDVAGKVRAVMKEKIEARDIVPVIHDRDEARVLLRGRGKGEAVDGAVVGRTDELRPLAVWSAAMTVVRCERFKMRAAIRIAQCGNLFPVYRCGHIGGVVYCVKIGNKRDGDPVIAVNLVIAADDDAEFAGAAGPQLGRRLRAYAIQIHRGVAGGIERAKRAIGLFHQQRDGGAGRVGCSKHGREKRGQGEPDSFVAVSHGLFTKIPPRQLDGYRENSMFRGIHWMPRSSGGLHDPARLWFATDFAESNPEFAAMLPTRDSAAEGSPSAASAYCEPFAGAALCCCSCCNRSYICCGVGTPLGDCGSPETGAPGCGVTGDADGTTASGGCATYCGRTAGGAKVCTGVKPRGASEG